MTILSLAVDCIRPQDVHQLFPFDVSLQKADVSKGGMFLIVDHSR